MLAVHIIAPVDFVDFTGSSAGGGGFEIAGEAEHGEIASFLVETDNHDGIGELGAVVGAVALVAVHVVAAGAKGKDVGAAVFVSF